MVHLCLLDDPKSLEPPLAPSSPCHHGPSVAARVLPYTVVFSSGQDENFPASELNKGTLGRGWQSSRFCSYPQEIVVELESPSNIASLQLLSHQYKIASKVEVFVSSESPWAIKGSINQMKQLGFVSLDPNDKTRHQARELKHISIDCQAVVVRLLLHTCFVNKMNAYNQVGIVALIITGEPLIEQCMKLPPTINSSAKGSWAHVTSQTAMNNALNNVVDDALSKVDSRTSQEILLLRTEKLKAVQMENYDEAKRLKNLIERKLACGVQIKELEHQKQVAVQDEDYDTAKSCKLQIEKIRESCNSTEDTKLDRSTQTTNPPVGVEDCDGVSLIQEVRKEDLCLYEFRDSWTQTEENNKPPRENHDSSEVDAFQFLDDPPQNPYQTDSTRKDSAETTMEDPGVSSEDNLFPEPLAETTVKEMEPILILIDPYYLDCLYSRHWQLRDKGLQHLGKQLQSQGVIEPVSTIRATVKVLTRALNDKVSNVFQTSLQVLRLFVERYCTELSSKELHNSVNVVVVVLLEKLGHSNVRVREAATEALLFLAMTKEIGLNGLAPYLLKAPKTQATWRPLLGRLQLLFVAIPMFGLQSVNQTGFPVEALMSFIIQSFGSPNGEVRNAAVRATVEAYRLMGPPLEKFLKGVKPAIHEVLIEKFEKVSNSIQKNEKISFSSLVRDPSIKSQKSNKDEQEKELERPQMSIQLEETRETLSNSAEESELLQKKPSTIVKVPVKNLSKRIYESRVQQSPHHDKPFQI